MSFDKTQPAPNISLRLSNPLILANWAALEDALGREHDFPGTMGSIAGQHKYLTLADQESDPETPASGKSILYAKSGLPYQRNSAGTVIRVMIGEGGGETKCWFFQDTAPIGWSIVSGCEDALLAVKGGSNAYNVAGGSKLKGSWTPAGHTHTGPSHAHGLGSHVHTTGDHTLTAAESGLPAHLHSLTIGASGEGVSVDLTRLFEGQSSGFVGSYSGDTDACSAQGASSAHNHGNTGAASGSTDAEGTGATGSGAEAATYRPLANPGIICSLN